MTAFLEGTTKSPVTVWGRIIVTVMLSLIVISIAKPACVFLDSLLLTDQASRFYPVTEGESRYTDIYIPSKHDDYPTAYNYLCLDTLDRTINDVEIHINDDGSITLNGTNSGEAFDLMLGYVRACRGEYILSGGSDMLDDGFLYIMGLTQNKNCAVQKRDTFVINGLLDDHRLFIHVYEEASLKDITIYPVIYPKDRSHEEYTPPSLAAHLFHGVDSVENHPVPVKIIPITRDTFEGLSGYDRLFLNNYIAHVAPKDGFSWVTLDFGDGTGIQYPGCDPKKQLQGPIDAWGRVRQAD